METFVCADLCLGICEHGVHNCDSGFRRLTSLGTKQTVLVLRFFFSSFSSKKLKLKSENLSKIILQTRAEADCQASLLCPQRARGSLESAFHSHFHSSHDASGMFRLVWILNCVWSDQTPSSISASSKKKYYTCPLCTLCILLKCKQASSN